MMPMFGGLEGADLPVPRRDVQPDVVPAALFERARAVVRHRDSTGSRGGDATVEVIAPCRDSPTGDVALVDSQWHEQWAPKTGVLNAADSRGVTFIRTAAPEAAAYYRRCGHLVLLRGFARVDNSLTVQIVDESLCSSSGSPMTFMNIDGHWRLEGEPHSFADVRPRADVDKVLEPS